MKIIYPIKICPWCKVTPQFVMMLNDETWIPHLSCYNEKCRVRPKSNYVAIRKTSKTDIARCQAKIEQAIDNWNNNNPMHATEGVQIDYVYITNYRSCIYY